MPAYVWKGKTRDGKASSGERVGRQQGSRDGAPAPRADPGLVGQGEGARRSVLPKFGGGVAAKDLAIFTRQFSVMIDAGLPLVQCLEILGSQQENKTFAKILQQARMDVEGGAIARRRHAQAPQGLRRPLRQHGRGRRGGRYPRHHPEAPGHLHREGGQAQEPGQGRHGLSGRRHLDRRHRHRGHPLEGHPDLRRHVRGPGRPAAPAHAHRHRDVELVRRGCCRSWWSSGSRFVFLFKRVLRHLQRAARRSTAWC